MPERLVNVRDVGRLPLSSGGATRSGVLYRSDAPHIGDAVPRNVGAWPPRTVIDLRSQAEAAMWPFEWPRATSLITCPIYDADRPALLASEVELRVLYESMLESAADRMPMLLEAAAYSPAPILVHCAAGKDRTGVVVAALLAAAAVEREAIIADYVATEDNMQSLRLRWKRVGRHHGGSTGAMPSAWLEAPANAIARVLDRIESWPGGTEAWWCDHGSSQAHLAEWRSRITG